MVHPAVTGQGDPVGMRASVLMIPKEEVWRLPNRVSQEREGPSGWDRGGNPLPKAVAGVGVCVCVVCVAGAGEG